MYYNTPDIHKYLNFIVKFRKYIILFFLALATLSLIFFQPKFLSSDELFWLKGSSQLQKTKSQHYQTYELSKLIVHIKEFDETTLNKLKKLHMELLELPTVSRVSSIFSNDFIERVTDDNNSNMVVVVDSDKLNTLQLKSLVKEVHNDYCSVVDESFQTFYFFISSKEPLDLTQVEIPCAYEYIALNNEITLETFLFYTAIFILITVLLFRILFRNYIAAFSAIILITLSTILTFTSIMILTGIDTMHITMPFITISIALVDFLYFYYRWHVSQYKTNELNALRKMLNRSMIPAMWTSVLTALGLGSLVLLDSEIIKLLSLSVIISSIIGYLLNLTLLPAMLSFFQLKHTHVPYAKLGYLLASNELHYNKRFLVSFLALSYLMLFSGLYLIYSKSNSFFQLPVKNEQIELKIPYTQIDLQLISSLDRFSQSLQENFEDELGEIVSLSTIVHTLNEANTQTDELDEEALLQALFYMDLYNLTEKYYDESAINLKINLFDINKIALLNWLLEYDGIELYFIDNATLLGLSKYSQTQLLSTSLLSALLLIGLITGWLFRSKLMVFVGFTINSIPILWFGVLITIFSIPLSLEMLIATTISLGLASDATIHFAFKYFRLRYFGRSEKHTLEKLFFYTGIPVIIGSSVLILVLASLYFSNIHSLQLIGIYSSILILLSLLTDLFILPVMLLFVDRVRRTS